MGNKARMYLDIMALNPEVTGSCFLCIAKFPNKESVKFIVDCGLFQEEEYENLNYSFPFEADNIHFALLTHNHVDHTGRLPLLLKKGFGGKIFCSKQTKCFLPLALKDSCKVLKDVCKRKNIKLISSMGTGNKMDPSRLKIMEVRKTSYDPIAKIIRKMVKDERTKGKVMVVCSDEEGKVKIDKEIPSNSFVPATAGLLCASFIINDIVGDINV